LPAIMAVCCLVLLCMASAAACPPTSSHQPTFFKQEQLHLACLALLAKADGPCSVPSALI
jgi:hypothetical protein